MRKILDGIAASPGTVQGRARIVLDESCIVCPKDILVAKFPGIKLMPLLIGASGLVTDTGGVLAHAAIVARELKIPAVVGVKNATEIIRDGDVVCVDGTKGVIYLVRG